MDTVNLFLLLLGALCFLGSTTGRTGVGRNGQTALTLLPLGLFFWILVPLIQQARVVF